MGEILGGFFGGVSKTNWKRRGICCLGGWQVKTLYYKQIST